MEAPGAAPGSEWFIATAIYFHSRRTGTLNIGRNRGGCKGPGKGETAVANGFPANPWWNSSCLAENELARFRGIPGAVTEVSCAAVGLFLAVIARMMLPLLRKRDPLVLAMMAAMFVAIGVLRLPLPPVLLVAAPVSIALTFMLRRTAS